MLDEEITDRFVIAHTMGGEGDEDEGVRWTIGFCFACHPIIHLLQCFK